MLAVREVALSAYVTLASLLEVLAEISLEEPVGAAPKGTHHVLKMRLHRHCYNALRQQTLLTSILP